MIRHLIAIAIFLAAAMIAPPASAGAVPSDAAGVVAAARKVIVERYVIPETATKLAAALDHGLADGRYRGLEGEALATRINSDMAAVTRDGHLGVSYDPGQSAILAAAAADAEGEGDAGVPPAVARMIRRGNGGVRAMEVLPGNIRYLAYDGFMWGTPEAEGALRTAMQFLREGDAIIIDLARNGGGAPEAVAAMASYFLPAGTPLMRFEMRGRPGEATRSPAAPFSLAGKPLYVLVGRGTASAAEEFASHVAAHGFGTLIGERTAGAGFRNNIVPLPGGYVLSVSVGRAVNLKTGRDWERVGIAPQIAVPAVDALARGKVEAMAAIVATAPAETRADDLRLVTAYRAMATRPGLARPLTDYAGRFGDRTLALHEGRLTMQRDDRAAMELLAIGTDRFVMRQDPLTEVTFVIGGGRVTAIDLRLRDGTVQRMHRAE